MLYSRGCAANFWLFVKCFLKFLFFGVRLNLMTLSGGPFIWFTIFDWKILANQNEPAVSNLLTGWKILLTWPFWIGAMGFAKIGEACRGRNNGFTKRLSLSRKWQLHNIRQQLAQMRKYISSSGLDQTIYLPRRAFSAFWVKKKELLGCEKMKKYKVRIPFGVWEVLVLKKILRSYWLLCMSIWEKKRICKANASWCLALL